MAPEDSAWQAMPHFCENGCKSLSLCYKKSNFLNMVQPINLVFCKMIEIIKRTFSMVQIFYLGPNFIFLDRSIFSADDVTVLNPEIPYKTQNQRKCYFSFIV